MTTSQRLTAGMVLGGRYRLLESLPDAWRARDELAGRDVHARVVPLPEADRDEVRQRVVHDAGLLARLRNPGIVHIVDALVEDGVTWIVTEPPVGRSLGDVIRRSGPLPATEVARIGLRVLDALVAAGVPHRNVTPENVLLGPDGQVAVAGFATASRTVGFLAPEGKVGPAADLWALGTTLFVAVEGRMPGGTATRAGVLRPVLDALLAADPGRRADAVRARALLTEAAGGSPAGTAADGGPATGPGPAPNAVLSPGTGAPPSPGTAASNGGPTPGTAPGPVAAPGPVGGTNRTVGTAAVRPTAAGRVGRADSDEIKDPEVLAALRTLEAALASGSRTAPAPRPDEARSPGAPRPPAATRPTVPAPRTEPGPAQSLRTTPDAARPPRETGPGAPRPDLDPQALRPVQDVPARNTPAQNSPSRDTPVQDTPAQDTPAQDTPEQDTPEQDTPAQDAPARTTPAASALTPRSPLPSIPVEDAEADEPGLIPYPDRPDRHDPHRHPRRRAIAAIAAVLAVIAAVLVPYLLRGGDDTDAGTTDTPAATATPAQTETTPSPQAAGLPPAGYQLYRDPAGWSVAVPDGWTPTRTGATTTFTDQGRMLKITYRGDPPADPYDAALKLEPILKAGTPGYDMIRIARVTYRGWPTADWEYRAGSAPVTHTLTRTVVPGPEQVYSITGTTADAGWTTDRTFFDIATRTFSPAE